MVPGAHLVLVDLATNATREADTLDTGKYTFAGLQYGKYRLTVTCNGFETQVFDTVVVQTSRTTSLDVMLKLGSNRDRVVVSAVSAPVLETQSNTLSTTLDLKQVTNLPITGRDVLQLSFLTPGYARSGADGSGSSDGSFNNTPGGAFQANIDGVNATSSRFKSSGGNASSVSARVENIQEFTVQSGELDPSQGAGQSAVQVVLVTNRGTNKYHGRIYEDHRNAGLNANSWKNNALGVPRGKYILNDFGGSIGGPILHDKLFFFGSYAQSIHPGSDLTTATVLTPSAAGGVYNYYTDCGSGSCPTATVNVLQAAQQAGYSGTINAAIAAQLAKNEGSYKYGTLTSSSTDLNHQTLAWTQPTHSTYYYPTGRVDYAVRSNLQLSGSFNYTRHRYTGEYASPYPGPDFASDISGSSSSRYVVAIGTDWTVKPTLLNQFRIGFLYNAQVYSPEAKGTDLSKLSTQDWGTPFNVTSGVVAVTSQSSFYPYITLDDNVSWQKGNHTIKFGGNAFREQDHYWNPPVGYPNISLGVTALDPVGTVLQDALPASGSAAPANAAQAQNDVRGLYAILNGRISGVNAIRPLDSSTGQYNPYGAFNLDELLLGGGLYVMDNYRATPNLTFNYGLRWDMIGDDHDLNSAYTGPDVSSLWGPSGVGNLFKPGVLTGNLNPTYTARGHVYHTSWVNPEPQLGFAWNPNQPDTVLNRLLGAGKSVLRGSFTLKNYTEGGQNFWTYASNYGFNFFQNANLFSGTANLPGYFQPGSLNVGDKFPSYNLSPGTFQKSLEESTLTFSNYEALAMNPNIRQPYIESYTLGYQRQIGSAGALEVRYVGNHGVHLWLAENINEVNIQESGFLNDFKAAQANLAANGGGDFENHGGGQPTPILTAAFGGPGAADFTNGSFVTLLKQGQVGALAELIAQNPSYYCNLVGQSFSPCAGQTTAENGAYPINLLQANPYVTGGGAAYLDAMGSSNYNALQIEYRQKPLRGLEFNANYTYAKSLGIAQQRQIDSSYNFYTLRNKRLNYAPSAFDIRNTLHASGTYDLPFGRGRALLHDNRLENVIAGGWTVGAIVNYQSGAPSQITGGYATLTANNAFGGTSGEGGVDFAGGATASTLQHSVKIRRSAGNPYVNFLSTKFQGSSSANPTYVVPHSTAGTIGSLSYLYGPKWINTDLALTKDFPIHDNFHMTLQGEFVNAFNHPAFLIGDTYVQDGTFGTTSTLANGPRNIELRANVNF